jgi:hypothetical protein
MLATLARRRTKRILLVAALGACVAIAYVTYKFTRPAFALSIFVHRKGEMGAGRQIVLGNPWVRPGDELRLRATVPRAGYLTVVAIGGRSGMETGVYYPRGPVAAAIQAGEAIDLPQAVEADDRVGNEHVYGLLCKEPIKVDDVVVALTGPGNASAYNSPHGGLDLPCDIATLAFPKCEPDECP